MRHMAVIGDGVGMRVVLGIRSVAGIGLVVHYEMLSFLDTIRLAP